jgi:hypothetical protein
MLRFTSAATLVRMLPTLDFPHTHSVKSLSRINPMCHETGGLLHRVFFVEGGMLVNLFFLCKTHEVSIVA